MSDEERDEVSKPVVIHSVCGHSAERHFSGFCELDYLDGSGAMCDLSEAEVLYERLEALAPQEVKR